MLDVIVATSLASILPTGQRVVSSFIPGGRASAAGQTAEHRNRQRALGWACRALTLTRDIRERGI